MSDILIWLGQAAIWVGLPLAVAAQIYAFFHIARKDAPKAVLALVVPGYVLYYVWRSEDRMPRLLRVWAAGFALFVGGVILVGLAMEM